MQIGVLTTSQKAMNHWERLGGYVHEILAHAGFPYVQVPVAQLTESLATVSVLILPTQMELTGAEQGELRRFVESGHVLVACGGTSGLDELLGCQTVTAINEAWVAPANLAHPVLGMSGPLHAFGGYLVKAGSDVEVLAHWLGKEAYDSATGWGSTTMGPAITVRQVGAGTCCLIAADLVHSVVRIQQGVAVHYDGRPAPDGSAPVNDGILKTDDGLVLDYERDRVPVANTRFFGRGIADEWRELLVREILWGASLTATPLPMLWYWPEQLQAVGLISHDSDGNDPALGEVLLANLQDLQIPSTWCIQYPGGYSPAFYKKLSTLGYEICLHYDAFRQKGRAYWREDDFRLQLDWLRDMAGVSVVSNKNHYLRWEGLTEFFTWLEAAGVKADQSKGPSKTGNTGFPFGGSHPWFPINEHTLRTIDVLEINLSAQDLVLTCPQEVGTAAIDWAKAHYGIAHLLFHPAHAAKKEVAAAMRYAVQYGTQQGLPWWTCQQITTWERTRRQIRFNVAASGAGVGTWSAVSNVPVEGATVLWFGAKSSAVETLVGKQVNVYGFSATAQVIDLKANEPVTIG